MDADTDIHTHRCGWHLRAPFRNDKDPALSVTGCGFEWTHERIVLNPTDYEARHRCPRCGEGPWYARVLEARHIARLDRFYAEARPRTEQELVKALLDAFGFTQERFDRIDKRLRGEE